MAILRDDAESLRAGGNRAYASSQHPIALAVLFCMIIPIAIYLIIVCVISLIGVSLVKETKGTPLRVPKHH